MRIAIATGVSLLSLSLGVGACSSSTSATTTSDGGGADGTTETSPVDAGHPLDAASDAEAATGATDAGTTGRKMMEASAACADFCSCMAMNCADASFQGGCLPDCAVQTTWDLPCRENMCSLVQAQPDNDHCTHAMGQIQCLDLDQ